MTKDALNKLIESVVDCSRAYQHALDQGPESEAVACESELKSAKDKLLAALAPDSQPEGPIIKILRKEPPFHEVWLDDLVVLSVIKFEGNVDITGHWRKVEP